MLSKNNLCVLVASAFTIASTAIGSDQFSQLACEVRDYAGEVPEIFGNAVFPVDAAAGTVQDCETVLVFDNQEAALVKRTLTQDKQIQSQVVIVSTQHETIRPIIGRSQQTRERTSSRSYAEGGSEGGSKLPPLTENITFIGARSMGRLRIGVETFQVRFKVEQWFKTTFASSQAKQREQHPLVELDLCGRRVNLEAGLYPATAAKHSSCENYTVSELAAFSEFWEF